MRAAEDDRQPTGFRLRTALAAALLFHLLTLVVLDRYRVLVPVQVTEPVREQPLAFVFSEPPKVKATPPPETRQLAAEAHQAAAPEPVPDEQRRPPQGEEVKAQMAQARTPAPEPRPVATRPPATPPPATPPPSPPPSTPPPRPTTELTTAERGQYSRRQPTPEPVLSTMSDSAIAQMVRQQLPGREQMKPSVPRGVMDFDAKDFDWGAYAQQIYKIIERNWHSELRTRVTPGIQGVSRLRFRIDRSGHITGLELLQDSQWRILDVAALGSIELSNPLPHLPADYPREDVGLTFSYYFNVPPDKAE